MSPASGTEPEPTGQHAESSEPSGQLANVRSVVLIGIAGPSGSGKSTVAERLSVTLASPLKPIQADWFFAPRMMPRDPKFGQNWETPQGLDFLGLREELTRIKATLSKATTIPQELRCGPFPIVREGLVGQPMDAEAPVVIVVEGFLLFFDQVLCSMLDAHVWVETDYNKCLQRRHQRDAPHVDINRFSEWYRGLVWKHFELYKDTQLANASGALHLDGSASPNSMVKNAVRHCEKFLSRQHALLAPART